jgi:hypothetical protein
MNIAGAIVYVACVFLIIICIHILFDYTKRSRQKRDERADNARLLVPLNKVQCIADSIHDRSFLNFLESKGMLFAKDSSGDFRKLKSPQDLRDCNIDLSSVGGLYIQDSDIKFLFSLLR